MLRMSKARRTTMKIELGAGAVRLGPNQTLKVMDGAGSTLCAVEGSLWITEEGQQKDVVIENGACYRLRQRGLAFISAIGGAASVSLAKQEALAA
jgi:hypothetical protein